VHVLVGLYHTGSRVLRLSLLAARQGDEFVMSVMGVTTTIENRPEFFTPHVTSSGSGHTQRASVDVTSSIKLAPAEPAASAANTSDARPSAYGRHNVITGCDQVCGRSFFALGKNFQIMNNVEVRTTSPVLGEVAQILHSAEQNCARLLAKLTTHV
jgi:hypothetical protein